MSTQPWEGEELALGSSPPRCAPALAELARHHLHTGNHKALILKEPKYAGLNRGDEKPKGARDTSLQPPSPVLVLYGGGLGHSFMWQSQVEGQRRGP